MSGDGPRFETFELIEDGGCFYRWRLMHQGRTAAGSRGRFATAAEAAEAAARFGLLADGLDYRTFDADGRWYWWAQTGGGERIAFAGRSVATREEAQAAGATARWLAPQAVRALAA